MSWNDFYRRRDVTESVLRRARHAPEGPLPFAEISGAQDVFGSEENLLLALHYKWRQVLAGYLRAEVTDDCDHVAAVTRAWRRAVRDNQTLRAVLDAHDDHPALHGVHQAQQRTLAVTAGLADAAEPTDEVTRVGAAFEALLRHGQEIRPGRPPAADAEHPTPFVKRFRVALGSVHDEVDRRRNLGPVRPHSADHRC
ncbi:MAG TPA: hypothetical protein VJT49_28070 [Amycolatopsis sp.]|uniref:hypothetical protein n=1 Tax=Amycolatopsis sp. TaxID=37632 RepID=UPI002B47A8FE|nr:hypothetical protein [Amycolatopsis sp.]HKS48896.1 hypothetical protein [Amycolatopsis sp.]